MANGFGLATCGGKFSPRAGFRGVDHGELRLPKEGIPPNAVLLEPKAVLLGEAKDAEGVEAPENAVLNEVKDPEGVGAPNEEVATEPEVAKGEALEPASDESSLGGSTVKVKGMAALRLSWSPEDGGMGRGGVFCR
jgi:hypothetical protein